jgi:hypothetical protein
MRYVEVPLHKLSGSTTIHNLNLDEMVLVIGVAREFTCMYSCVYYGVPGMCRGVCSELKVAMFKPMKVHEVLEIAQNLGDDEHLTAYDPYIVYEVGFGTYRIVEYVVKRGKIEAYERSVPAEALSDKEFDLIRHYAEIRYVYPDP